MNLAAEDMFSTFKHRSRAFRRVLELSEEVSGTRKAIEAGVDAEYLLTKRVAELQAAAERFNELDERTQLAIARVS